jgi:hypothetical protein
MSLFIGANISSFLRSIDKLYPVRRIGLGRLISRHRHPLEQPRYLKKSRLWLAWLISLELALAATDVWLHFSAKPGLVPTSSDLAKAGYQAADANFARTINTTLCDDLAAPDPNSIDAQTCGLIK